MAYFDDFSNLHKNHANHPRECDVETGPGERDYFEHVCAQTTMSGGERVLTLIALAFVAVIGVMGYFGSTPASARSVQAASISETQHWQSEMECEVYARHPRRDC